MGSAPTAPGLDLGGVCPPPLLDVARADPAIASVIASRLCADPSAASGPLLVQLMEGLRGQPWGPATAARIATRLADDERGRRRLVEEARARSTHASLRIAALAALRPHRADLEAAARFSFTEWLEPAVVAEAKRNARRELRGGAA